MTHHFPDYKSKVVAYYLLKKEANDISPRLLQASPAMLREECIARYKNGIEKKDVKNLLIFFDEASDDKSLPDEILNCRINKFKPLQTFLNKPDTNTNLKNIELLAWLIDYPYRPYELGKTYGEINTTFTDPVKKEVEKEVEIFAENEIVQKHSDTGNNASTRENKPFLSFKKRQVLIAAMAVCIASGIYFYPKKQEERNRQMSSTLTQACMYWTGDHYQKVPCTQKLGDTLLIPLDSARLMHFKKIVNWNVITKNSVDNIWYCKINEDSLELYTADGTHPVYRNKRLKHLTTYMYNNYIKPRGK